MSIVLQDREYQNQAVDRSLEFLGDRKKKNGIVIVPTGGGKSLIAARIALGLDAPTILLQPRKELVEQNRDKLRLYGFEPAIFSASLNSKGENPRKLARREVGEITLATIKSVVDYPHLFEDVRYVLIDECAEVNPKEGQYKQFFNALHPSTKYLGLDATPFRRHSTMRGTQLRFLTRQTPRLFNEVVHYTQLQELFEQSYLARLEYFSMHKEISFGQMELEFNSNGSDYTDESVRRHLSKTEFAKKLVDVVARLIKTGRRGILVFTRFTEEAEQLAAALPGLVAVVTAKTPSGVRTETLAAFRSGAIKVVANVGILGVGFDYPELDTCVLARHTLSLRIFYQQIGRIVRPHPEKESGWVVDMVGNLKTFGRLEHLKLYCQGKNGWAMWGRPGGGKEVQLTNVYIGGAPNVLRCPRCKSAEVFLMRHEDTNNQALLSRPPEGTKPNVVIRFVTKPAENGKPVQRTKVWAYPKTDDEDYNAVEFVLHRAICKGKPANVVSN